MQKNINFIKKNMRRKTEESVRKQEENKGIAARKNGERGKTKNHRSFQIICEISTDCDLRKKRINIEERRKKETDERARKIGDNRGVERRR